MHRIKIHVWPSFMQARVCSRMHSLHTGRALFTSRRVHVKDFTTNSLYGGAHTGGTFTSTLEKDATAGHPHPYMSLLWSAFSRIWCASDDHWCLSASITFERYHASRPGAVRNVATGQNLGKTLHSATKHVCGRPPAAFFQG